jgi:hypothetical protein
VEEAMKKLAVTLAFAAAMATAPAYAQQMANAEGNTFVVTEANGVAVRYHFNNDGTWDAIGPDGSTANGTYSINGAQICLTPAGAAQPGCTEYHGDKNVGDTWTQLGTDGAQITVSLVAGRP